MKIAFIHDWEVDWRQEFDWRDGLAAAVRILADRHELKFWVCGSPAAIPHPYFPIHVSNNIPTEVEAFNPDVILMWGDCTRPNAEPLSKLGIPMALCFAGGDTQGHTNQYFDHFFVESQTYLDSFEVQGKSVSRAFGTNTALFEPLNAPKHFDALFPATYCTWKRHRLFNAATKGLRAATAGYMIPGGQEAWCYEETMKSGAMVLPHVSAEALRYLFAASKTCVITSRSDGGSQRTVLEAMSMNIPVIVMRDSDKTSEYVREGGGYIVMPEAHVIHETIEAVKDVPVNTRDYIVSKYSETHYADALEAGLKNRCGSASSPLRFVPRV